MNKDIIRHKILKVLVENHDEVLLKYGNPGLNPSEYEKLQVPVNDVIKKIKISYQEFNQAKTKAIKEKAFEIEENSNHDDCCTLAENTFLFYNEKTYLKASKKWYQTTDFWNKVLLLVVGGAITILVNLFIDRIKSKNQAEKQLILEQRLDSLIIESKIKK